MLSVVSFKRRTTVFESDSLMAPSFAFPECQCNGHASSCQFDPDIGFGRCLDCQHNTTGALCDQCLDGFYRNVSLPIADANACIG